MDNYFDYRRVCYIRYSLIKKKSKSRSLFICWFLFFLKMIGYLLRSPYAYKKVEEVLVVIPSSNNKRSIQPILDAMKHKNYSCVERFYNFLPFGKIYLKSFFLRGCFNKLYYSSTDEEKYMIRANFEEFAAAVELDRSIGDFYDFNPQVKLLIVSNDHFPIMRSFIEQARTHGIKTLYSQHASVSEHFPPLVFDYSFLDGEESYLKYKAISRIEGNVFLVGSPRFDVITQLERQKSDLIGVAVKKKDDYDKILSLINTLKEKGLHNIVVRPHPQWDKQNTDWSLFTNAGCEMSHPLQENPFKFISRISFLIAGASSIHLEAALLRIPSAIYSFRTNEANLDYYGYAKMGLTPLASNENEIVSLIKKSNLPSIDTIRYYDAAFGTEYDGKSASLAAQFIDAFLDGHESEILCLLFKKTSEGYYIIK